MKKPLAILLLALALSPAGLTQEWQTEAISNIDLVYMERQRERIDALSQRHLNHQLAGDRSDLALLQQLLDTGVVRRDDGQTLQAMGVVMGDLLKREHGLLWSVYIDKQGRSRALAIPGTKEFLFPITMISRRYEVGGEVDTQALFDRAGEIVADIRRRASFSIN